MCLDFDQIVNKNYLLTVEQFGKLEEMGEIYKIINFQINEMNENIKKLNKFILKSFNLFDKNKKLLEQSLEKKSQNLIYYKNLMKLFLGDR